MLLSLDLSTNCTGYTIFDYQNNKYSVKKIDPPSKLSTFKRINYVVSKIKELYPQITELAIEDTFHGLNAKVDKVLDRLGGAVINSWLDYSGKEPYLYNAASARKIIGLDPRSTKAEIQLWVLAKFFPKIDLTEFKTAKDKLLKAYVKRKISRGQKTRQLSKLTDLIAKETGINNDQADSVVVGLAHLRKVYNIEVEKFR
jgi:Holliday junction resolvasome RuvABC endonuclease subunit